MANIDSVASTQAAPVSPGLQRVLRQLLVGGAERRAIEAGEIDAVIDYGSANVIVFPAARRALRDSARRTAEAERRAALELPRRNSLLAALPRAEYGRLLPALEPVMLEPGDVLHEADAPIRHAYFPVDCVVCLLTPVDDQRTVVTGIVGHEGMLGTPLALDVGVSAVRAVVEVAGTALRMPAARFRAEFQRGLQLQRLLYRCIQLKMNQARQFAVCIASHQLEQRLANWLLMIDDRSQAQPILMTHEHLAAIFDVRRVSITLASGSLRERGLISHDRGKVWILDRQGLESASCRCHRSVAIAHTASSVKDGEAAANRSTPSIAARRG